MTSIILPGGKDLVPDSVARTSRWAVRPVTSGVLTTLLFVLMSVSSTLSTNGSIVSPRWNKVPMPVALESHQAVAVQLGTAEFLYVIGGKESGTLTNEVYFTQLNPDGLSSGWIPTLSIYHTTSLQEHSAVVVNDCIYVLGGRGNSWNTFSSVYCAKPETTGNISNWTPVAQMRTGLALHTAVAVDNVIFVIGGYSSQRGGFVCEVWAADITGDDCSNLQWRRQAEESLLHSLAALSAAVVRLDNGRKFIYVTGGYDGTAHKLVWRAEVDSNNKLKPWNSLGDISQAPSGFFRHISAFSGRYLYVIGGTTDGSSKLDAIYRARIKDDGNLEAWSTLEAFPDSVFNHAVAVSAPGRIYVLGGNIDSGISDWGYFTPLLGFQKSASPADSITYGDTVNYTLKLSNLGVRDLGSLSITDTIKSNVPTTFEFHDLPSECQICSGADDTITCTVSDLKLGETKDLDFEIAFFQPTSSSSPAPNSFPASLGTPAPHITWTQTCAPARLEVLGVGISDTLTNTLYIPNPETIATDLIRAQVVLQVINAENEDEARRAAVVIFSSGGASYPLLSEPTSFDGSIAVYEQDIQKSDAISVTVIPVREKIKVREDGLTAYFLRSTEEGHSLTGSTMNHFVHYKTSAQHTQVLTLPLPVDNSDVIVQAVLADNDPDPRPICLTVQADGASGGDCFDWPSDSSCLDIVEVQLSGVPMGTTQVTVTAESPYGTGDSFSLVGLSAETKCTPLRAVNKAEVCEVIGSGQWCMETGYINTELHVYLPIVLKNAP